MKKLIVTSAAIVGCLALQALSAAAVAAETAQQKSHANTAHHRDPMQASASMGAATVAVRYDSGCRAKYAPSSVGYQDCLQRLPATALIGGR